MKIENNTTLLVLAKNEKQGIKDPTKTYYSLVIMQDEDAGSISCPKEVYDAVKEGQTVTVKTEFNQTYNSFRVTGLAAGKEVTK